MDANVNNEIEAEFSIEQPEIDAEFDLSTQSFDALLKINTIPEIESGSPLIGVDKDSNTVTITSQTYVHEQGISSDTWTITHNLNKFPSVTLVDTADTQFQGRVEYIDENTCVVYMNGATKGKAYLN